MTEERLHKVMAAAGVGSRRACEEMITAGRVQINGQTVTELGHKVDADTVQITVDGKPLRFHQRHVYVKVNKPRNMLSDIGGDARGRRTVEELIELPGRRVYPVGRLDLNSEGLVLLTDDGELAHRLSHPRFEHTKTYYVLVAERPTEEALAKLRQGVDLPTGRTAPAQIRVVDSPPAALRLAGGPHAGVWLEIALHEGKKRQIRHMTAAVGYPTLRLVRWAIGPLTLGTLGPGEAVHLTRRELNALKQSAQEGGSASAPPVAKAARRLRPQNKRSVAGGEPSPQRRRKPRNDR